MKLETTSPSVFEAIENGKPFWHVRRQCWGVRCKREGSAASRDALNPNAVLFFSDGNIDTQLMDPKEPVVPAVEIYIRIVQ